MLTRTTLAAAVMAAALTLAGCSADDTGPDIEANGSNTTAAASATPTATASTAPTPEVVDGVALTGQGSQLALGQDAAVAYEPRQGQTGVLDITVTRLERTSFKRSFVGWDIPTSEQSAQPYFVRATVTNRGTLDLGGRPVPLYIVDGTNTLIEATTFASTFKPCKPGRFPKSFPTGATTKVCLVYLAPNAGSLTAVSFRPTQRFDPITWTGALKRPRAKPGSATSGTPTATPTAASSN